MAILRLVSRAVGSKRLVRTFAVVTTITILIAVVLTCAIGALYWRKLQERQLIEEIARGGGNIFYDYQLDSEGARLADGHPAVPVWLRRIAGEDMFGNPVEVDVFPEMSRDLLPAIAKLKTLRRVKINAANISREPFKAIGRLPSLEKLVLCGDCYDHNGLGDLGAISQMPTLTFLGLESLNVTDSDCDLIVQKFPSLQELSILDSFCGTVSDKGLAEIRKLAHLRTLHVESNGLSYGCIATFSGSSKLAWLSAAVGRDVEGLQVQLHDCPALERVDISQADGIGRPWRLRVERVPKLREISVEYVSGLWLEDTSNIEKLSLNNSTLPLPELSEMVIRCNRLGEADLMSFTTDITPVLKQLIGIVSLRKLSLQGTKLTDAAVTQLALLKQLIELDLSYSQINDGSLRQLEGLVNLRSLSVFNTNVTEEGAKRIEKAIPGIHCVLVNPNPGMISRVFPDVKDFSAARAEKRSGRVGVNRKQLRVPSERAVQGKT